MDAELDDKELEKELKDRFTQLPKVVQNAITSAGVEKHLRDLAESKQLHLDQWQILENLVQMTLLGLSPIEELAKNIKTDVNVSEAVAQELAGDISKIVFEPIRQELERELEHPEAKKESVSNVEAARREVLEKAPLPNEATAPKPPAPIPATPVTPSPTATVEKKAERGPASGAYIPGEPSSARKVVEDDPYREPPA